MKHPPKQQPRPAPGGRIPADAYAREAVRFYRQLGFFGGRGGPPDQELARRLRSAAKLEDAVDAADLAPEAALLACDARRVWTTDQATPARPGAGAYAAALEGWASISGGRFRPTAIQEAWDDDGSALAVAFELDGGEYMVFPDVHEGEAFDVGVLDQVNDIVGALAGFQFERVDDGERVLVIALTPEERERIEFERGVRFEGVEYDPEDEPRDDRARR